MNDSIGSISIQEREVEKEREGKEAKRSGPFSVPTGDDAVGHLSRALLVGNVELAVEICLEQKRTADALALAMQGGPELMQRTQRRYYSFMNRFDLGDSDV